MRHFGWDAPATLQRDLEIGNLEMNEITKTETQVPAPLGTLDPYSAYGAAVASQSAPFLKFVKGVYQHGSDDEELPVGTKMIPNMAELRTGFIKWYDGQAVEERMVRIIDGEVPTREECGELESANWPTDANGVKTDPWQNVSTLPMRDPETGQQFVFTTGSHGGRAAIGKLSFAYGRQRQQQDGKLPIIEMGASSYRHKSYGEVHIPVFHIVGWKTEADLIAGKPEGDTAEALDDEIPFG